jgi:hypothetical protein
MGWVARSADVVDAVGRVTEVAGVWSAGAPSPAASAGVELRHQAQLWVERTCGEQGVPVKVRDRAALARVATLLREVSDAPDRLQSRRVKPVPAAHAGADDDMVQDGGDSGAALVEVEVGPLGP